MAGSVDAQNGCGTALALLLEPVETIGRKPDQLERWIDPQESATARLIIDQGAKSSSRDGPHAAHLDTGFAVSGGPGYVVVPAGQTIVIPLVGTAAPVQDLAPGVYRAVLTTYLAAVGKASSTASELRLDRDVAAHNARNQGAMQVEIQPDAELVRTDSITFEVPAESPSGQRR